MVMNSFGNKNFMQPMGRLCIHSKRIVLFSFEFGLRGRNFFTFLCSLLVPNGFPVFPLVFPIAPCFNPICFAQSPPLLTYIVGYGSSKGINVYIN